MIPEDLDLKQLRKAAGLTQSDLAVRLNVEQSQVQRYEANPENVPLRVLREWVAACGQVRATRGLDAGTPYAGLLERLGQLDLFSRGQPVLERGDTANSPIGIENLLATVREQGRKPRVLLAGPFNAGKSRLANALMGTDALLTAYRPTTRIVCMLRHASEKPDWQPEHVWVMRDLGSAPRDRFDITRHRDRAHCERHRLLAGDFETLNRVGTHPKEGDTGVQRYSQLDQPVAAIAYVDAAILRACDIVDTPGFQSDERDTKLAFDGLGNSLRAYGDILVYLSPLSSFLSGADLAAMGALLEMLPVDPALPQLRQFAVLATHAHHNVKNEELVEALDAGAARLSRSLGRQLRSAARSPRVDAAMVRARLFPWYVEIDSRRDAFEADLRELLAELRPGAAYSHIDAAVNAFKQQADAAYAREADYLRELERRRTQAEQQLHALRAADPLRKERMAKKRRAIEDGVRQAKDETRDFLRLKVAPLLLEQHIRSLIERDYPESKDAEQHAANAIINEVQSVLKPFIEAKVKRLAADVDEFLAGYAALVLPNQNQTLHIPFDAQGTFAGALAAGGVFGALALWAATATTSNLGAYILVAQAAGVLSSLGISFTGGAAGAVGLVAALGGPVTIGAAIALAAGVAVFQIFGRSWQSRLASRIASHFEQEKTLEKIGQQLDKLWDDTLTGFQQAATATEAEFGRHIEQLKGHLALPADVLAARRARVEARRAFLSFVPWPPLSREHAP